MNSAPFKDQSNREEALKCIDLSKQYFAAGDMKKSIHFAEKSLRLCNMPEGKSWFASLSSNAPSMHQTSSSSSSSSSSSHPSEAHHFSKSNEKAETPRMRKSSFSKSATTAESADKHGKRSWTPEQQDAVKEFQAIKKTDLYGILSVSKDASDIDIKKAYRKRALVFHPDKNSAPGADEAFKTIGYAFALLSDSAKREQYDRYGADILSEASSGSTPASFMNPFDELSRRHPGFFNVDIDADDLFSFLFSDLHGEGLGHGRRRNRNFYYRNVSSNQPFGGPMFQQQYNRPANNSLSAFVVQLVPIFILLFLTIVNQFLFGSYGR